MDNTESLGGGIFASDGKNITITESEFRDNFSRNNGGGVYISKYEHFRSEICVFTNNLGVKEGGGMYFFKTNNTYILNGEIS